MKYIYIINIVFSLDILFLEINGTMVGCSSTWRPLSRGNYIDKVYSFNDILNALDERESDGGKHFIF